MASASASGSASFIYDWRSSWSEQIQASIAAAKATDAEENTDRESASGAIPPSFTANDNGTPSSPQASRSEPAGSPDSPDLATFVDADGFVVVGARRGAPLAQTAARPAQEPVAEPAIETPAAQAAGLAPERATERATDSTTAELVPPPPRGAAIISMMGPQRLRLPSPVPYPPRLHSHDPTMMSGGRRRMFLTEELDPFWESLAPNLAGHFDQATSWDPRRFGQPRSPSQVLQQNSWQASLRGSSHRMHVTTFAADVDRLVAFLYREMLAMRALEKQAQDEQTAHDPLAGAEETRTKKGWPEGRSEEKR